MNEDYFDYLTVILAPLEHYDIALNFKCRSVIASSHVVHYREMILPGLLKLLLTSNISIGPVIVGD